MIACAVIVLLITLACWLASLGALYAAVLPAGIAIVLIAHRHARP
ncbi:MAG TPA: hypothetical protein VIP77_02675 [Jiangellaceae bacterium]